MASFIALSFELLDMLEQEYPLTDDTTIYVGELPEKVLANHEMELFAHSMEEPRSVNMRSPSLRRGLEGLAALGSGHHLTWRGVRFRFVLGNNMLATMTYTGLLTYLI